MFQCLSSWLPSPVPIQSLAWCFVLVAAINCVIVSCSFIYSLAPSKLLRFPKEYRVLGSTTRDSWRRSRNRATLFWCTWRFSSSLLHLFRFRRESCLSCRATRNPFSDQTFTPFTTLQSMVCTNSVMGWPKRLRWGSFLSLSLALSWRNFWVVQLNWN